MIDTLYNDAVELLKKLIAIPSLSKNEQATADCLVGFFLMKNIAVQRQENNVWARSKSWDANKPIVLLNSHHDTVLPNAGYLKNPYLPQVEDGKLFGLGSNDAGGSLVSLAVVFACLYEEQLPFNLIYAATAEEEISGANGIESILNELGKIDVAIVGEPTQMQMAIAERGLLVVDAVVKGISSHAAHDNPKNPIYMVMDDINWIKNFRFPKTSAALGEVKMTVTIIEAGKQHNVVPAECKYTIDIRTTDAYKPQEILNTLKENLQAEISPRSTRLRASAISATHEIVIKASECEIPLFVSHTLSDQALMPFPSVKMGPGDTKRSHTADEFIYLNEIKEAIEIYLKLLKKLYR